MRSNYLLVVSRTELTVKNLTSRVDCASVLVAPLCGKISKRKQHMSLEQCRPRYTGSARVICRPLVLGHVLSFTYSLGQCMLFASAYVVLFAGISDVELITSTFTLFGLDHVGVHQKAVDVASLFNRLNVCIR